MSKLLVLLLAGYLVSRLIRSWFRGKVKEAMRQASQGRQAPPEQADYEILQDEEEKP